MQQLLTCFSFEPADKDAGADGCSTKAASALALPRHVSLSSSTYALPHLAEQLVPWSMPGKLTEHSSMVPALDCAEAPA